MELYVRFLIDGFSFIIEGYERAKNILKIKYGKESEIVNVYVSGIMFLSTIYGINLNKILEFYEKLCLNV